MVLFDRLRFDYDLSDNDTKQQFLNDKIFRNQSVYTNRNFISTCVKTQEQTKQTFFL